MDNFVNLVRSGGAVDEHFVRTGIKRPGVRIVFAEIDGKIVGVAALKKPADQYRSGLEGACKANHPLPIADYLYELGYVSVSPDHGKRGVGKRLVENVLGLAKERCVFCHNKPSRNEGEGFAVVRICSG